MPRAAATAKVRGPYAKSARIQAEVIDKATEAFSQRGFTATSMREIALAVGMTQQGLSHHFPSKEALLEAVLRRRDELAVDQHRAEGLSVMDTLRSVVQDNLSRPGLVRLTATLAAEAANPDHPAHEFFENHFAEARKVFAQLLAKGQKSGEVRDDLPAERLATSLVSAFEGLQLQWLIDPDLDLAAEFETVVRMLEQPTRKRARR